MTENQNTERKESWRGESLKWLCWFVNAEVGVVVISKNAKAGNWEICK